MKKKQLPFLIFIRTDIPQHRAQDSINEHLLERERDGVGDIKAEGHGTAGVMRHSGMCTARSTHRVSAHNGTASRLQHGGPRDAESKAAAPTLRKGMPPGTRQLWPREWGPFRSRKGLICKENYGHYRGISNLLRRRAGSFLWGD